MTEEQIQKAKALLNEIPMSKATIYLDMALKEIDDIKERYERLRDQVRIQTAATLMAGMVDSRLQMDVIAGKAIEGAECLLWKLGAPREYEKQYKGPAW